MKRTIHNENLNGQASAWFATPILFIIAIIPLIVRLRIMPVEGIRYDLWIGVHEHLDFYAINKAIALWAASAIAVILLIYQTKKHRIPLKKSSVYIPMALFAVLIIASTYTAEFRHLALWGFVSRHEGMITLLAYLLTAFAAINLINTQNQLKLMLWALYASSVIISIIGLFQFIKMDFWETPLAHMLIFPQEHMHLAQDLTSRLHDRAVYSTLLHFNYVGGYMAMILPISVTVMVLSRKNRYRMASLIITIISGATLVTSNSRAGMVGTFVAMIFALLLLRKELMKKWKVAVALLLIGLVGFTSLNIMFDNAFYHRAKSIVTDPFQEPPASRLKDIQMEPELIAISTQAETLHIHDVGNAIMFKDERMNPLSTTENNGKIEILGYRYQDFNIEKTEHNAGPQINVTIRRREARFVQTDQGFRFLNYQNRPSRIFDIPSYGFEGRERMGSSRGYIWSRSIPLMKDTMLLGHGPDTFAAYFPQHDYVGKLIAYRDIGMIVDKPHNLFLQTAINTGLLSLVALLAMFGIYTWSSFRLYRKSTFKNFHEMMGAAIFLSFIGYVVAGLFNDSAVVVAPVFWALFGTGISINEILKKQGSAHLDTNTDINTQTEQVKPCKNT